MRLSLYSTISTVYAPPSGSPWSWRGTTHFPVLDNKLTRREGGALDVTVFRKPTHTDRYLHFSSHHPASVKRAAVRSLFDRARNVTLQKENLREEEEHLNTTFKQNGYPLPFIHAISSSIQEPPTPSEKKDEEPDDEESQEDERKPPLAVIPYVSGVNERIRKACEKFDLRVVFKSGPTLCQCGKVYVGETQRRLETRVKEHRDACNKGDMWKSAIAKHQWGPATPSGLGCNQSAGQGRQTCPAKGKGSLTHREDPSKQ